MVTKNIKQILPSAHSEHKRRDQLADWVLNELSLEGFSRGALPLKPVSNDASFRKYYRVQGPQGSLIAVDSPPEKEDNKAFIAIAEQWRHAGINVPIVHAYDLDNGFMLLEDFGDQLLLNSLNEQTVEGLYHRSFNLLHDIQSQPSGLLPLYDEKLLRFELSLYPDWFLQQFMGLNLEKNEKKAFEDLFDLLVSSALEQPRVTIHRDFHSRNLMLLPEGKLGVIDFQGALNGPVLYDAVSLLKDCYQSWPKEKVKNWLLEYADGVSPLDTASPPQILKWFDWIGLQRHLKCLGIFSRLWLRDGRASYLGDIPKTLEYVLAVCRAYPELEAHSLWLETRVLPSLSERVDTVREEAGI